MIVIDASCIVEAIVGRGDPGREARALVAASRYLAAPDLIDAEVVSGIRGRWIGHQVTDTEFADALDELSDLSIERYLSRDLFGRAYELRANVTAYDACYVHLAELLEVPLYTGDRRLSRAPGIRCEIRVLGDAA